MALILINGEKTLLCDARGQVPGMRVRWQVGIWQQPPCMYTNRQRVDANASAFFVTPTGFNNIA